VWTHYLHASLTIIGCAPLYSISQDAELHDRYVRETTDLKKQLEQALKRVADNASAADADKKAAVEAMQRQVDALTAERTELNGIVERARRAHEKMVDEVNTLRQVGGVAAAAAGVGAECERRSVVRHPRVHLPRFFCLPPSPSPPPLAPRHGCPG